MARLQIADITFNALRESVYEFYRLGSEETEFLIRKFFDDVYQSPEELVYYQTVYEFVYAKMTRCGYNMCTSTSPVPEEGTLSLRLRLPSRRKTTPLMTSMTAQQSVTYETSSEDEMDNEKKDRKDYCRVLS